LGCVYNIGDAQEKGKIGGRDVLKPIGASGASGAVANKTIFRVSEVGPGLGDIYPSAIARLLIPIHTEYILYGIYGVKRSGHINPGVLTWGVGEPMTRIYIQIFASSSS